MSTAPTSRAAALRAQLDHPVIDADGHWLEFGSLTEQKMRKIGGNAAGDGFAYYATEIVKDVLALSREERLARRVSHPVWWGLPTRNTLDRATAMLPRLLHERLDEFGIDFSVLFPTVGFTLPRIPDAEARRAACRAFNVVSAETFAGVADRMTPVAVIPMHHPEEAIAELEHAIVDLGLKAATFGSLIVRPIPALADVPDDLAALATWRDVIGLDSAFDYDPVWQRCVELGVSPTFHTGARDVGTRRSPTNFVYNHLGHFGAANEAVCKALLLGGVTRRFPGLKFAFLEGGVSWACQLYSDLIEHWETRNLRALERLNPANLDVDLLIDLAQRYGEPEMADALRKGDAVLDNSVAPVEPRDDFAACAIERAEDLRELFAVPFYFGCEAEDPMSSWAYDRRANPFGAQLNTLFGSDIGHFDVSEMADVVPEAHELVDRGLVSAADFRALMFENPVRLWGQSMPRFFQGTRVEAAAEALLGR